MITIDKQSKGNDLTIGGERILPDEEGNFIVQHEVLLNEDLSSVPSGTIFDINYQNTDGRKSEDLILVRKIQVLDKGRVRVTADHYRCPCCWEHALSFHKYCGAIMEILHSQQIANTEFVFETILIDDTGAPFHIFSLEVDNGLFKDVEKHVKETMMQMLKPLLDFCDSFDAQTLQQFGV